jgi:steroid delta-isomerase-like uncharacterized protein
MRGAELPARHRLRASAIAAAVAVVAAGVVLRRRKTHDERRTMADDNKAISRSLLEEAFNNGNLDAIDELVTPTVISHDAAIPEDIVGVARVKEVTAGYRAAFPDLTFKIEQQIGDGDLVATQWTARGTQEGELMGIPPSGKQATVTGITIDRFEDGRIAESWTNWDTLGLLQQIGAIPSLAQA